MAISFTGGSGLFTRLGKEYGDAVRQNGYAVTTIPSSWSNRPEALAAVNVKMAGIQQVSEMLLVNQVNADTVLRNRSVEEALMEVERQMTSRGYYIDATAVTIGTVTAASGNTGNGSWSISKYNVDNRIFPNIRSETLSVKCLADALQLRTVAGEEMFRLYGQDSVPNLDANWPTGSGINAIVHPTEPSNDGSNDVGRNMLTNSDFEDWTGGTLLQWTTSVGTSGVDFTKETSTLRRGLIAFKYIAGTGVLTKHTQLLGSSTGTLARLKPYTKYAIAVHVRYDAGAPTTGVLRLSVRTGGGSVIGTKDGGGNAELSIDLTALSAGWNTFTMYFQTDRAGASTAYFTMELTTAVATNNVFVDDLTLCEPFLPVLGGPYVFGWPGTTNFAIDDRFTSAITNDAAGDFARWLDRFHDLWRKGIVLPTSGSTNIADSLIA